ncbi:MAG: hypothetical protein ACREOP_13645 [Thermodesulfobacteriota bacterium]
MGSGSEYIKEIESYFLTLVGEGIMLSPIDYSLIQDWKKRQVPREVVLKGINKAFSESGTRSKGAGVPPRSLKHCVSYVEKCIEEYGPPVRERKSKRESRPGGADAEVPERLEQFIHDAKSQALRDYYIKLRKLVLGLDKAGGANDIPSIMNLEKESLEEFFRALPDKEREKISIEAEKMIKDRARYMTKGAYDESLVSFRNEILGKKYGIKCIIS